MKSIKCSADNIIAFVIAVIFLLWFYTLMPSNDIGADFAAYWSSGRLLLDGRNPYSAQELFILQNAVGRTADHATIMYSPPWVLTLILPFCALDYTVGKYIWFLVNFSLLLFCIGRLWNIYGGSNRNRKWARLVCVSFVPMIYFLKYGQMLPVILFGLVTFLYFEKQKMWRMCGLVVVLIAFKPHIIYLFWIALIFWICQQRHWSILVCGVFAFSVILLVPVLFNSSVLSQYFSSMADNSYYLSWHTPTIGTYLRFIFGEDKYWLHYFPTIIGMIWFSFYWLHYYKNWEWDEQYPLIIFVSLMTSIYLWPHDYLLMIVGVIQSVAVISRNAKIRNARWIILFYVVINVLMLIMGYVVHFGPSYIWVPPALFLNYILLRAQIKWLGNASEAGLA
jgi:hypothetical protein